MRVVKHFQRMARDLFDGLVSAISHARQATQAS